MRLGDLGILPLASAFGGARRRCDTLKGEVLQSPSAVLVLLHAQ